MKKCLSLAVILSLLLLAACSPGVEYERKISSADILGISKGMTFKEINELLGNTCFYYSPNSAPNFFSYIVDGNMRYTQTFSEWTDVCELSGGEILNKVREENMEIAPCFAEPETACEEIKDAVFGSSGWHIIFANESFMYAVYNEYAPYIIRYNIEENEVDRALDVKGLQRFWPDVMALAYFTPDGRYLIFRNDINWMNGDPLMEKMRFPFPAMYIYEIDFEESRVDLLSDSWDGWSVPEGYNYIKQIESRYRLDINSLGFYGFYEGENEIRLSVLEGYWFDSDACVVINEDTFAIMLRPQSDGLDLGYYSFAVVNVTEDKLLGRCAVNEEPA